MFGILHTFVAEVISLILIERKLITHINPYMLMCLVFMFSKLLYIAGKIGHHLCLYWGDEIYLFHSTGTMQNKSSHFHCLKCEFVCSDTNKVVAHRRQHQKLDSIMAAGFEKFTPFQPCNMESCAHAGKQTHYHCLSCQYAVLGLSQMSAHKLRHMEWHIPIFALSQV